MIGRMGSSSSNPENGLAAALRQRRAEHPDGRVAYLVGSQARGSASERSDVDVAVLLRGGAGADERLRLVADLDEVTGAARVDVVVLNDAPPALGYRVLRDGRLLVSRDEQARVRHWVATVDRYLDMAPARRMLEEGLRHRLEESRFGRS
jgi:uncharacterized protein